MEVIFSKPWLRVLSGLFVNLGAGWFGLAFITPNFINLSQAVLFFTLIRDIVSGILCLLIAVAIEGVLEE